jgi:hypothetical protein
VHDAWLTCGAGAGHGELDVGLAQGSLRPHAHPRTPQQHSRRTTSRSRCAPRGVVAPPWCCRPSPARRHCGRRGANATATRCAGGGVSAAGALDPVGRGEAVSVSIPANARRPCCAVRCAARGRWLVHKCFCLLGATSGKHAQQMRNVRPAAHHRCPLFTSVQFNPTAHARRFASVLRLLASAISQSQRC